MSSACQPSWKSRDALLLNKFHCPESSPPIDCQKFCRNGRIAIKDNENLFILLLSKQCKGKCVKLVPLPEYIRRKCICKNEAQLLMYHKVQKYWCNIGLNEGIRKSMSEYSLHDKIKVEGASLVGVDNDNFEI